MNKSFSSGVVATKVQNCLIVTVGEDLSDGGLKEVSRVVLRDVHEKGCSSIVFELSALKFMDTVEFEGLKAISSMADILGAQSVFVGIQPGIVSHLVANDSATLGVVGALDLNDALEMLGITHGLYKN